MDTTAASTATATPRWLVSRAFDLTWFFGGGLLSLIVLALYFAGAPIVALWWIWLLAFDGPHIGAAFTGTYFDAEEWRRRPGLLLTSLLTFAVGPVFLALTVATGSQIHSCSSSPSPPSTVTTTWSASTTDSLPSTTPSTAS